MIVLKVELNGETVVLAGKQDLCVLNAMVGAAGVLGPESRGTKTEKDKSDLRLNVGGLGAKSDEDPGTHYNWVPRDNLSIGDKIEITILDQVNADLPLEEKLAEVNRTGNSEKAFWEEAKKFYFEHKDKYEKDN